MLVLRRSNFAKRGLHLRDWISRWAQSKIEFLLDHTGTGTPFPLAATARPSTNSKIEGRASPGRQGLFIRIDGAIPRGRALRLVVGVGNVAVNARFARWTAVGRVGLAMAIGGSG